VGFTKEPPVPHRVRALYRWAPSRTVIAHYALNGQIRSKAHTALTAPFSQRQS
jgi:hypothetical protein